MATKNQVFDWNHAKTFLVAAEQGSLSAAAKKLGTTQPTVGRQIYALEQELGVTLFERVPQGLTLTESGIELLECVRSMGNAADEMALRASGQSATLQGPVCISASEVNALHYLPRVLEKVRRLAPGIQIEVVVSNEASDLKQREADIALRSFRPTQPDLIAKKLAEDDIWLYGTPDYLRRALTSELELGELSIVAYERSDSNLALLKKKGLAVGFHNLPIVSQSYVMQWELVKQGLGLGMFPASFGDAEPRVQRAFESLGPLVTVPIWLVCHRELHTSLRVRKVFDLIAEGIS